MTSRILYLNRIPHLSRLDRISPDLTLLFKKCQLTIAVCCCSCGQPNLEWTGHNLPCLQQGVPGESWVKGHIDWNPYEKSDVFLHRTYCLDCCTVAYIVKLHTLKST